MKKKTIIFISIAAGTLILALILVLSFSEPEKKTESGVIEDLAEQYLESQDAVAGENNSEIVKELTAAEVSGYYIDESDGWYYDFVASPNGKYDGTFTAGFDADHASAQENPQKNFTAGGDWKLEHGEIKLYSNDTYQSSMWACADYIVDSQNYFVGDIDPDADTWQTVFVCKPGNSGDTQIFNFYSDGKMIMEIKRNDGKDDPGADSSADSAAGALPQTNGNVNGASSADLVTELPSYELFAGTYQKNGGKIAVTVGGSTQEYHIVNDGLAKWIYKKQ